MDIIPNIIGEVEFEYLPDYGYNGLAKCLTPYTAECLYNYIHDENIESTAQVIIQTSIGEVIESIMKPVLILNNDYEGKDILSIIRDLNYDTAEMITREERNKYIVLFNSIEEQLQGCPNYIKPPTKYDFKNFLYGVREAIRAAVDAGCTPTYPNILDRIHDNEKLFYINNREPIQTSAYRLRVSRNKWISVTRGCEWYNYCDDANINEHDRGVL